MIVPLNNAQLETGLRAYLIARFEAAELTVPAPDGSQATARVAPRVICSTSAEVAPENQPYVVVLVGDTPPDATGVYGERMVVRIVALTPYPYPPGISAADHAALAGAVAACFPARPAHGAPGHAADLAAWEALNEALSDAVEASAGYLVNGWFPEGSRTNRTDSRIEDVFSVRPCVFHPDLA